MLLAVSCVLAAQQTPSNPPTQYGPYNATILPGGNGLRIPISPPQDAVLKADAPWTLSCWFNLEEPVDGLVLLTGVGDVTGEYPHFLALEPGKAVFWDGAGNAISGPQEFSPGSWHMLTATFDGSRTHLFADGKPVAVGVLTYGSPSAVLQIAPPTLVAAQKMHFGGQIAGFTLLRRALDDNEVKQLQAAPPPFALLSYEEGSKPWPFQTRGQAGYRAPQDPALMPQSRARFTQPMVKKRIPMGDSLAPDPAGGWTFADGWTLREAPKVKADPALVASTDFPGQDWMRATVPGTVLTTMIDDGIYPDPDYGLNNLAIPESLNKQDYWYRNVFSLPAAMQREIASPGAAVEVNFAGINYQAEIWLNGQQVGSMKGAFRRGVFDVTALLKSTGQNVLAVRIAPPPHPGIPQEQSILGGPGENGGTMELDGPTFLATEGWDWIPAIRDRDSGIWQPVTLTVRHTLKLGDVRILPVFHQHDMSQASVEIDVPLVNSGSATTDAQISVGFDGVLVEKTVRVAPGETVVKLLPAEFSQLNVSHPRLWWPNGYGKPELHTAKVSVKAGGQVSDTRQQRFGMREISYELSLLDSTGHLRRVQFTPSAALGAEKPLVDVSHEGIREIPGADAIALNIPENRRNDYQSFVSSLAPSAEHSPAIEPLSAPGSAPYLTIRVNNVRIAARGGNWGMDDARKRVSREHLEPFFRLDRDANMNIIRNWVGQSTEETFFDLADEYGMMVWNDFWESTQNYNLEAEDPALFLDNAADTIRHFRNHPSIVLWCGRNEGVPQSILNQGLERLVRSLDGTRFYSPSSNQVNLQQSGPYSYQDPALYYTTLNRGFSVETGTPSMSTLESFESTIPEADQWPMDDVWAYHDWHASGNGRTAPFMAELEAEFGVATSLADFERKAQMLNYVDHRAIFEGMNANLWAPNSGRMLWMTQPAWPSTMWQILSSDYDTQASFFGSMKGSEPVHVQINLATGQVDAVNTTIEDRSGLTVSAKVYSLDNRLLVERKDLKDLPADSMAHSVSLPLRPLIDQGVVLVKLQLTDSAGMELSRNLYWLGKDSSSYRALNTIPQQAVQMSANARKNTEGAGETVLSVKLTNAGSSVALASKLTLFGEDQKRILPAYYSDNYVSLLPGESQTVEIRFPAAAGRKQARIALRGWNVVPQTVPLGLPR